MTSVMQKFKRLAAAGLVVAGGLGALPAGAVLTPAGTSIANRAAVTYSVGGVAQTQVNSAPGAGNSTPGAAGGADTTFLVDRVVDYTLTVVDTASIPVTPGQTAQVTTYLVTNTGNGTSGFALTAANLAGVTVFGTADTINMANLKAYGGTDAVSGFNAGTATLGYVDSLPANTARRVFVVADVPTTAVNGDGANVSMTVTGALAGSKGATPETATAGADDPTKIDVAIAVAGNTKSANSGYLVQAPVLTVAKSVAVISDPVNGTTNPKAIPGAVLEYTVTMTNGSTTQAANGISITDPIVAQVVLQQGVYNGAASNVTISTGTPATTRYCVAEAGADANADGCNFSGGNLVVNPTVAINLGTTAATNSATIKFQVKVN